MKKQCLENQLCFKLYAVSRMITGNYRPLLQDLGMTYPQYLVMLVLWKEEHITVKELGKRLYLDSGTLTPLLKRLALKHLITRTRDQADERSVIISLSKTGRSLQQKTSQLPEVIAQHLSGQQDDYEQLKKQLDKLLDRLTIH